MTASKDNAACTAAVVRTLQWAVDGRRWRGSDGVIVPADQPIGSEQLIANLGQFVPKLQKTIMLPDCGHWTQQEKPNEVNSAIIAFLKELTH